jgi:hypothetical protein
MAIGYKQPIDTESLNKLEADLEEFIAKNPPGHAGMAQEVERVAGSLRRQMEQVPDGGCGVIGSANALVTFIRWVRGNRASV